MKDIKICYRDFDKDFKLPEWDIQQERFWLFNSKVKKKRGVYGIIHDKNEQYFQKQKLTWNSEEYKYTLLYEMEFNAYNVGYKYRF
jgi:hypothetical protein